MFEDIIGHERQKKLLELQLGSGQYSHSYLFYGPSGSGKRSLAIRFAKEILRKGLYNKERVITDGHPDLYLVDETGLNIKEVRELIHQTQNKPLEGSNRVFVIDYADRMQPVSQNALLKTLEEPIAGNVFILVAERLAGILPTIKSRCQILKFDALSFDEKRKVLQGLGRPVEAELLFFDLDQILSFKEDPELLNHFDSYFKRFKKAVGGDVLEALALSEELGADKNKAGRVLEYFIYRLFEAYKKSGDRENLVRINALFELNRRLNYNINLRLQWENSLLNLQTE